MDQSYSLTLRACMRYRHTEVNIIQINMDCCRVQWCDLLHCGNVILPKAKITPETLIFPEGL